MENIADIAPLAEYLLNEIENDDLDVWEARMLADTNASPYDY